ncbi:hypothetical protein K502DRAFT_325810, partial [Neoconidiobolus thromboides FSU 785]
MISDSMQPAPQVIPNPNLDFQYMQGPIYERNHPHPHPQSHPQSHPQTYSYNSSRRESTTAKPTNPFCLDPPPMELKQTLDKLKSGLESKNNASVENCIKDYIRIASEFQHPDIMNQICIDLSVKFSTCDNDYFHDIIYNAFKQISKFITKENVNLKESVKNITSAHFRVNFVARTLCLKILKNLSHAIEVDNYIYYLILLSLNSDQDFEIIEALAFSKKLIGINNNFVHFILPFLGDMLGLDCEESKDPFSKEKVLKKAETLDIYLKVIDTLRAFRWHLNSAMKAHAYCLELLASMDIRTYGAIPSILIYVSSELASISEVDRIKQASYLFELLMEYSTTLPNVKKSNIIAIIEGLILLARSGLCFEPNQMEFLFQIMKSWYKNELLLSKCLMLVKFGIKSMDLEQRIQIFKFEETLNIELNSLNLNEEINALVSNEKELISRFIENYIKPYIKEENNMYLYQLLCILLVDDDTINDICILSKKYSSILTVIQSFYSLIKTTPDDKLNINTKVYIIKICIFIIWSMLRSFIKHKKAPHDKLTILLNTLSDYLILLNKLYKKLESNFYTDLFLLLNILKTLKRCYFEEGVSNLESNIKDTIELKAYCLVIEWIKEYAHNHLTQLSPQTKQTILTDSKIAEFQEYPKLFCAGIIIAINFFPAGNPLNDVISAKKNGFIQPTWLREQLNSFAGVDSITNHPLVMCDIAIMSLRLGNHPVSNFIFSRLTGGATSEITRIYTEGFKYWSAAETQIKYISSCKLTFESKNIQKFLIGDLDNCSNKLVQARDSFKTLHYLAGYSQIPLMSLWVEIRVELIQILFQYIKNIMALKNLVKKRDIESLYNNMFTQDFDKMKSLAQKIEYLSTLLYQNDKESSLCLSLMLDELYVFIFALDAIFNIEFQDIHGNTVFPKVQPNVISNLNIVKNSSLECGYNRLMLLFEKKYYEKEKDKLELLLDVIMRLLSIPCSVPSVFFSPYKSYKLELLITPRDFNIQENSYWSHLQLKGRLVYPYKAAEVDKNHPSELIVIIEYCPNKNMISDGFYKQSQSNNYNNNILSNVKQFPRMEKLLVLNPDTFTFNEVITFPKRFVVEVQEFLSNIEKPDSLKNPMPYSGPVNDKWLKLNFLMLHPKKQTYFLLSNEYFIRIHKGENTINELKLKL